MNTNKRIQSIDALRGFDMLMIIVADRFFYELHEAANTPLTGFFAEQFDHPEWFGFHFYDIIMPLFLFLVGAVIPYSLSSRMKNPQDKLTVLPHLGKRFIILFILGWIVQGRLLLFDLQEFKIFSNTLQAIAVGYVVTSLSFLYLQKLGRYVLFAACLFFYALILTIPHVPGVGSSTLLPDQNFAIYIDRLVFGAYDDGLQYTWFLTGLGFTATTLSGLLAGELIKGKDDRPKVALYLFYLGVAFAIIGMLLGIWHPIVKKIWSSSFVLFSSGLCYLLLALFYWIIDVKQKVKWAFALKVIGMNAITAYVLSHVISFPDIANNLLFGLEKYTDNYYSVLTIVGGFLILYWLLWYMYRNKTFIKV